MTRFGGIVLCGGQSKRMGRPKAWLPFGSECMLQRIVRIVGIAVDPVTVVAAQGQELPALPADILVVRDSEPSRGPMQGLAAGLRTLQTQCDAAYVSSCDVPFLLPGFISRMVRLLDGYSLCVPRVSEIVYPLSAVYRVDLVATARRLLAVGRAGPVFLVDEVPTRIVGVDDIADVDPTWQSLRNVNSPEDYKAALRDAGITPGGTGDQDRGA